MLTVENEGDHYTISLSRITKLNAIFSGLIGPQVQELLVEPGRLVTMDLSGIQFIDSSGLDMLARATNIARTKNSRFELINLHREVKEVIDMIGLTPRLVIVDQQVSA
jgi:anti-anti-sigma factor